ncbi:MAG: hypothetical protein MRZ73_05110 [Pseudoflavonifractor capillosus]|uniref:hypothetical protein n=1 Tax=Pseudoflavonifractor capillosus TaxID=106588 RepID=UPI0023F99336|nr:hypothetical protein [Pseudoflavonifractor capillosus]MCI5927906.1 hypothetical protein [Pseudoflavonifractor capillosus]MDY4661999.1 hypothetical protein [Pseudoflavonifractor capillosus]
MRYGYIIGGGFLSVALCYLILMVLNGLGAGGGLLELMSLFLLMALPGIIVGAVAAEREKREKEISELKEELTAIRTLLEKQDKQ